MRTCGLRFLLPGVSPSAAQKRCAKCTQHRNRCQPQPRVKDGNLFLSTKTRINRFQGFSPFRLFTRSEENLRFIRRPYFDSVAVPLPAKGTRSSYARVFQTTLKTRLGSGTQT